MYSNSNLAKKIPYLYYLLLCIEEKTVCCLYCISHIFNSIDLFM